MAKIFSIVIPVYNQARHLLLTLTSLEMQTFPKRRFEIVVVNDGSTDHVEDVVNQFHARLPIKYIYNPERKGRAFARNLGVQQAKGNYLVHMDADFLVIPAFLRILYDAHRTYSDHVISAWPNCTKSIYTHYYPDFSEHEKGVMSWLLNQHGLWNEAWWSANQMVDIISPEDVQKQSAKFTQVIASWERFNKETKREYMSTDVAPWLMFVTRCVSMSSKHFHDIGGFNEEFVKYGSEDWELGYRLHQKGIQFRSIKQVVGYHQEHPGQQRTEDLHYDNLRIIYKRHGTQDPQLALISFCAPWEDGVCTFKSILRILAENKVRTQKHQHAAQRLEYAISCLAEQFLQGTGRPHYD